MFWPFKPAETKHNIHKMEQNKLPPSIEVVDVQIADPACVIEVKNLEEFSRMISLLNDNGEEEDMVKFILKMKKESSCYYYHFGSIILFCREDNNVRH